MNEHDISYYIERNKHTRELTYGPTVLSGSYFYRCKYLIMLADDYDDWEESSFTQAGYHFKYWEKDKKIIVVSTKDRYEQLRYLYDVDDFVDKNNVSEFLNVLEKHGLTSGEKYWREQLPKEALKQKYTRNNTPYQFFSPYVKEHKINCLNVPLCYEEDGVKFVSAGGLYSGEENVACLHKDKYIMMTVKIPGFMLFEVTLKLQLFDLDDKLVSQSVNDENRRRGEATAYLGLFDDKGKPICKPGLYYLRLWYKRATIITMVCIKE